MQAPTPPQAVAVETVAAQATEADIALIARLEAGLAKSLPKTAYIVKIKLKALPEATSQGWALYIEDLRIPKYWAYTEGIYFKVFDPQFFEDHQGGRLRFSQNGTEFTDTGLNLAVPQVDQKKSAGAATRLPLQDHVLK
jgi:hypothetical protein